MSSRLIVKNIPNNINEEKIKTHFSKFGDVTDVKIIINQKNKQHRRFCFIGYKFHKNAKEALSYFNNTYLQASKISVEFAKTKDEEDLPNRKTFGQKRKAEQELEKNKQKQTKKEQQQPEKSEKFKEFLELMKSGASGNMSWNDVVFEKEKKEKQKQKKGKKEQKQEEKLEKNLDKYEQQLDQEKNNKKQRKASKEEEEQKKEETDDSKKTIDSRRLYVVNLPYKITEDEVRELFSKYGFITELKLIWKDKLAGITKGFCFVQYQLPEEAMHCFSELDNKIVYGRILHVRPAFEEFNKDLDEKKKDPMEEEQPDDIDRERSSYKKQKKVEMRKKLEDTTNWNTLFLNPNSILEAISAQYNVKKSDILSAEAEDLAVRSALAETQVIKETKEWMLGQGFNLDFLDSDRQTCERSDTILLVKNLPFTIQEEKLRDIFSHYGQVDKVMLAPNKSIGIVEFFEKGDAENAFKNLSYHIIKHNPMYLEWAPFDMVDNSQNKQSSRREDNIEPEDQEDQEKHLSTILFVKNLNFKTTDAALQKHFEKANVGDLRSVKIVRKKEGLSSGYGFVEFKNKDGVMNSLKKLQNSKLDDHVIQLSVSKQKQKSEHKVKRKEKKEFEVNSKIVVRNLAFETSKKELRDLFKTYGEIKSVRLPQKINGQHRGFAFVEFISAEEAKNAVTSLGATHLYGRKLAIEYAKQDFDV